jgi:hypothetical protein
MSDSNPFGGFLFALSFVIVPLRDDDVDDDTGKVINRCS